MPRKKSNRVDKVEHVRERLEKARQKRLEAYKSSKKKENPSLDNAKEEFRKFWAKARREHGKSKELGDVVWAHFKASGFLRPQSFEKGLRHFGLKAG